MQDVKKLIDNISQGKNLTFEESKTIFLNIMNGDMDEKYIYNFLTNLSKKGETAEEIAGGVYILREKALKVKGSAEIIDTCGTGGDGKNTLNISTASSLLLSSMNIKVAKHGNKALSSKCGSADVLEKLNININLKPNEVERSIDKNNFGFMFAPNYHSAMKYVGPTRKKIGKRTIFNLIGPLSNPANVKKQVIGVYSKDWLLPFAYALKSLSSEHVWIVHGQDGMDEISPFCLTNVVELKNNKIREFIIDPQKIGLKYKDPSKLIGNDAEYNAKKILEIFNGLNNEFAESVCLNSAAGLVVSGKYNNYEDAYKYVFSHLMSGKVIDHLKRIQSF